MFHILDAFRIKTLYVTSTRPSKFQTEHWEIISKTLWPNVFTVKLLRPRSVLGTKVEAVLSYSI